MQYAFASLRDEYRDLWSRMTVVKVAEANSQAKRIIEPIAKARYKAVEEKTGVPWFVVGCLHMRESNVNFSTWLHNGDPMRRNGVPVRTVNVPKGRPADPNVTWEQGAYDALVVCEQLDQIKDWGPEHVAYAAEKFNGFGYRNPDRAIPSPYLWGGTNVQKTGKFIRDGVYDASIMDTQIGAMAVLKQIMALDPTATFTSLPPVAADVAPPVAPDKESETPAPVSPKADDTVSEVKPLAKSKTMWGGAISWLAGIGTTFASMFQYIATPWGFAAFITIIIVISVGAYLVFKGRIDVQAVVKHLSQDDTANA